MSTDKAQQLREATRRWRKAHPEAYRTSNQNSMRKLREQHPERILFYKAKHRAKKLNLPFNLEPEDVTIPSFCPVLGIALQPAPRIIADGSPTLDRIIPELGYVKGNITVVSNRANRIKNDASLEELERVVKFYKVLQQV